MTENSTIIKFKVYLKQTFDWKTCVFKLCWFIFAFSLIALISWYCSITALNLPFQTVYIHLHQFVHWDPIGNPNGALSTGKQIPNYGKISDCIAVVLGLLIYIFYNPYSIHKHSKRWKCVLIAWIGLMVSAALCNLLERFIPWTNFIHNSDSYFNVLRTNPWLTNDPLQYTASSFVVDFWTFNNVCVFNFNDVIIWSGLIATVINIIILVVLYLYDK